MRLPARRDHRFEIGLVWWRSFIVIYRPEPFYVRTGMQAGGINPAFLPNVTIRKQKSLTFRVPVGVGRSIFNLKRLVIVWARVTLLQYTCTEVWTDPDMAASWPQHKSIEFWTVKGIK